LGVFGGTAHLKATCTRMIVEYGAHTSPADMALWEAPGFIERAAGATADAIAQFLGVKPGPKDPQGPQPQPPSDRRTFPETGASIVFGFKGFWERLELAGLAYLVLGYPTHDERAVTDIPGIASAQRFERGWLVYR